MVMEKAKSRTGALRLFHLFKGTEQTFVVSKEGQRDPARVSRQAFFALSAWQTLAPLQLLADTRRTMAGEWRQRRVPSHFPELHA